MVKITILSNIQTIIAHNVVDQVIYKILNLLKNV